MKIYAVENFRNYGISDKWKGNHDLQMAELGKTRVQYKLVQIKSLIHQDTR